MGKSVWNRTMGTLAVVRLTLSAAFGLLLFFFLAPLTSAQPPRRLPPVDAANALHVVPLDTIAHQVSTGAFVTPAAHRLPCCDGSGPCCSRTDSDDFTPWSKTEIHLQYGRLAAPSFFGGARADTTILTFQHASGWRFGDNFFFVDLIDDHVPDGFNDRDVYMEWYSNLSLGKILRRKIGHGILSDVGILGGINYAPDANFMKWLPGMRLSWDLPGFAFFNSDFTAFLDDNGGVAGGGAPRATDSFMIDINWDYLFSIGRHDFSIQGHVEFISDRRNELGSNLSWWIFAQPQFRYDLGKTLLCSPDRLFVGIEWQIWENKLGDPVTDENAVQALVVWRL